MRPSIWFLAGLWPESDEVWGRVLGKEPIPCLSDVLPYVTAEEGCRSVMMGNGSQDISALKIEYEGDQKKVWQQKKTDEKDTQ